MIVSVLYECTNTVCSFVVSLVNRVFKEWSGHCESMFDLEGSLWFNVSLYCMAAKWHCAR